jgi:outer membrane protein assembly factor BamB
VRSAFAIVLCLLVAEVAAGAGRGGEAGAWTAYGHDAQLTNFVSSRVLTPKTAPRLRRVWSRRLDGSIVASPLVAPGSPATVVVATEGGSVVALAASTGKQLWRRSLGTVAAAKCGTFGISSTGAIDLARGRVYVIGASGELHALSLATGEEAPGWPVRLIERTRYEYVWGGLRLSGKRLYVPVASYCDVADDDGVSAEGRLVAVDVDDPTHMETFDPVPGYGNLGGIWGYGGVSLEPGGGVVYTAIGNSQGSGVDTDGYGDQVVALSPDLSKVLDSNVPATVPDTGDFDFGAAPVLFQPPGCPPLAAANNKDGDLYVWNRRRLSAGPIAAIRLGDDSTAFLAQPSWSPRTKLLYVAGAALTVPNVDHPKGVVALRVRSGCRFARAWTALTGFGNQPPPIVVGDVVLADGGDGGDVFALDARTGRRLWRASTRSVPVGAPLVYAAGTLVAGDAKGTVYAFRVGPKRSLG